MRVTKQSSFFVCLCKHKQNNNNTKFLSIFFENFTYFTGTCTFLQVSKHPETYATDTHCTARLYIFSLLQRSAISFSNSYWLFEEEHIWHLHYHNSFSPPQNIIATSQSTSPSLLKRALTLIFVMKIIYF